MTAYAREIARGALADQTAKAWKRSKFLAISLHRLFRSRSNPAPSVLGTATEGSDKTLRRRPAGGCSF
jgi:hypothetical protein